MRNRKNTNINTVTHEATPTGNSLTATRSSQVSQLAKCEVRRQKRGHSDIFYFMHIHMVQQCQNGLSSRQCRVTPQLTDTVTHTHITRESISLSIQHVHIHLTHTFAHTLSFSHSILDQQTQAAREQLQPPPLSRPHILVGWIVSDHVTRNRADHAQILGTHYLVTAVGSRRSRPSSWC